jgi:hypothetical protein
MKLGGQENILEVYNSKMKAFNFITKDLQAANYTHASAFKMLSVLTEEFPSMKQWIGLPSKKAENPEFEQEQQESSLSAKEKEAVKIFLKSEAEEVVIIEQEQEQQTNSAELTTEEKLRRQKAEIEGNKSSQQKDSEYINLDWIACTTCFLERLFSEPKSSKGDAPLFTLAGLSGPWKILLREYSSKENVTFEEVKKRIEIEIQNKKQGIMTSPETSQTALNEISV